MSGIKDPAVEGFWGDTGNHKLQVYETKQFSQYNTTNETIKLSFANRIFTRLI